MSEYRRESSPETRKHEIVNVLLNRLAADLRDLARTVDVSSWSPPDLVARQGELLRRATVEVDEVLSRY